MTTSAIPDTVYAGTKYTGIPDIAHIVLVERSLLIYIDNREFMF